jgi:NAD-dependent DNA ligase
MMNIIFNSTMMNVTEIDSNPEVYAEGLTTADLSALIERCNYNYYNTGVDCITDNAYDALVYVLNKRLRNDPKGEHNQTIVGTLPQEKMRSDLPYFMPSLNKVKADKSLSSFIQGTQPIVASNKLDGVSGMIIYEDGEPMQAFLRGNGEIGGDISYIIRHMNLPSLQNLQNLVVRGEFILSKDVWRERYSSNPKTGSFGTSRNFVCGKLNAGRLTNGLESIAFVAYDIMHIKDGILPRQSECLKILEEEGFEIVRYSVHQHMLISDVIALYNDQYNNYMYPIDGIVLTYDTERCIPQTLENPSNSVAFKMNLDLQMRITNVTGIDWSITRTGRIFPTIEYETRYIEGRKVHRATGHNARKCIQEWKICIGTIIKVTLSGSVIPQVVEVIETGDNVIMPPAVPSWHWSGADIMLDDIEGNPTVHLKRQLHFLKTIKIKNIGEKRLEALHAVELNTLSKLINASEAQLQRAKGIGPKLSKGFREDVRTKIPNTKLYRLMQASCCFPKGMGKVFLRVISTHVPNFLTENIRTLPLRLQALNGIGPKRSQMFMEGLVRFKVFLQGFPDVTANNKRYFEELERQGFNENICSQGFVFTVCDDDDLEDYITDHQGVVQKAVSENTRAVITGNPVDLTTKTQEAHRLGVKVYTIAEFKNEFNITI